MREKAKDFFTKLYEKETKRGPKLDGLQLKVLNEFSRNILEKELIEERFLWGLMTATVTKCQIYDGFNMKFL